MKDQNDILVFKLLTQQPQSPPRPSETAKDASSIKNQQTLFGAITKKRNVDES